MAPRASRWPDVADAVLDLLYARAGYRAAGTEDDGTDEVLVMDGPELELTADYVGRVLLIGTTLDVDGDDQGQSEQSYASIAPAGRSREETGQIRCQVIAQTGALELADPAAPLFERTTLRWLRRQAFDVLDDVAAALAADTTLGLGPPLMSVQLSPRRLLVPRQYQTDRGGAVVTVEFAVQYTTRL